MIRRFPGYFDYQVTLVVFIVPKPVQIRSHFNQKYALKPSQNRSNVSIIKKNWYMKTVIERLSWGGGVTDFDLAPRRHRSFRNDSKKSTVTGKRSLSSDSLDLFEFQVEKRLGCVEFFQTRQNRSKWCVATALSLLFFVVCYQRKSNFKNVVSS